MKQYRASYLGHAIIEASELKDDCKGLNFAICSMEDHHERAWMIFERGTICCQGDHPWQPYLVRGPSKARKIATDGPGNQFLGDHRWQDSPKFNVCMKFIKKLQTIRFLKLTMYLHSTCVTTIQLSCKVTSVRNLPAIHTYTSQAYALLLRVSTLLYSD